MIERNGSRRNFLNRPAQGGFSEYTLVRKSSIAKNPERVLSIEPIARYHHEAEISFKNQKLLRSPLQPLATKRKSMEMFALVGNTANTDFAVSITSLLAWIYTAYIWAFSGILVFDGLMSAIPGIEALRYSFIGQAINQVAYNLFINYGLPGYMLANAITLPFTVMYHIREVLGYGLISDLAVVGLGMLILSLQNIAGMIRAVLGLADWVTGAGKSASGFIK